MQNNKGLSLWCILFIIFMITSGVLLYSLLSEINKRVQTEEKLVSVQEEKRNVENKLDQAHLEVIQLKDASSILEQQLNKEKETLLTTLAKLESKDLQIADLETTLQNEKKQKENLTNTLAQVKEEHADLEEELKQAHLRIETLESQINKNEEKANVKLEKIVIKPIAPVVPASPAVKEKEEPGKPVKQLKQLSGKVLVVNREFNFVVIDMGKKDGVNIGNQFAVYQDSEEIAKIQVEKIYDTMATATILSGSQAEKLKENNIVKSF